MNRNDENALTYDTRNLFNSNLLQQYDSDGQKGFLGYLLRHKIVKCHSLPDQQMKIK